MTGGRTYGIPNGEYMFGGGNGLYVGGRGCVGTEGCEAGGGTGCGGR